MPERFNGTINVDIRDSEPDWSPFEPPKAPDGAPNVLYIVLDDVGFSALGSYGGPIETPNIDRIVDAGVRYTQFHTTALCSPTRSCLLTGRNHTRNSMACITEAAIGFPNASGTIPPENGMLSEILGERGWNTYMVGKWHLCPTDEMNLAAPRRNWPTGRGFERWYGFLGAETNQWYPDLVYDNHMVDQPSLPEDGYHLTDDITDKALEFIRDAKAIAPEKPFFLYYAPGACHAPHQAPKEWIDKFKGQFDAGYEAMREQTLAKQKELGIVPADTELPPLNPIGTPETRTGPDGKPFPALDTVRPWDSLNDDGETALRAHGGGLRGLPRSCRPSHRAAPRLPRACGRAGEHRRRCGVGQRRLGRGRPERLRQRDEVRERRAGRSWRRTSPRSTTSADRRRTTTIRPVGRWRSTRRSRCGSATSSTAARATHASSRGLPDRRPVARSGSSTTTRSISSRRFWTCSASIPRDDQGAHTVTDRRCQHARELRRRCCRVEPEDAVLRDARLAGYLARGLEGRHDPPRDRRVEQLQRRRVGAVPHPRRPLRAPQPCRRATREGAGARQPLVCGSGREHCVPAGRPLSCRDLRDAAAPAHRSP